MSSISNNTRLLLQIQLRPLITANVKAIAQDGEGRAQETTPEQSMYSFLLEHLFPDLKTALPRPSTFAHTTPTRQRLLHSSLEHHPSLDNIKWSRHPRRRAPCHSRADRRNPRPLEQPRDRLAAFLQPRPPLHQHFPEVLKRRKLQRRERQIPCRHRRIPAPQSRRVPLHLLQHSHRWRHRCLLPRRP